MTKIIYFYFETFNINILYFKIWNYTFKILHNLYLLFNKKMVIFLINGYFCENKLSELLKKK